MPSPPSQDEHVDRHLRGLDPSSAEVSPVWPGFEGELIDALKPIQGFALACVLHHMFSTGIFDQLAVRADGCPIERLAEELEMDCGRLTGVMEFLQNEELVELADGTAALTRRGRAYARFRSWYTVFIGGYGSSFLEIGRGLSTEAPPVGRDLGQVGVGSCGISHFDAVPLTRQLMDCVTPIRRMLDLGCGDGRSLIEFCMQHPELEAWGIEPSIDGYAASVQAIKASGLADRVRLQNLTAQQFVAQDDIPEPDVVVLGFVLHEILGAEGEAGVRDFLSMLTARFPRMAIIVIEVDHRPRDRAIMKHELARAYYNPYYVFHHFTNQRLETRKFWERLFYDLDLAIVATGTTDPRMDSTGLELGFALRYAGPAGK